MDAPSKPRVAVAIPAYNEADGIGEFLREIDRALAPHVQRLNLVVVDDASTDNTRSVVDAVAPELICSVELVSNQKNQGHGPSLMHGYALALADEPDFVLQVDGDGQFHGSDLRRVLVLLLDDAPAVSGVRRFRQDPWFRMTMTRFVRFYMAWRFGVHARDPNCPLRGYDTSLLSQLLEALPQRCLVPNLYLTIVAARRGVALLEVDVSHRVRRGRSVQGTMWDRGRRSPVPWRLVKFSLEALLESRKFRGQLDVPDWARRGTGAEPIHRREHI